MNMYNYMLQVVPGAQLMGNADQERMEWERSYGEGDGHFALKIS